MSCPPVDALLAEPLDPQLAAHLDGCSRCRTARSLATAARELPPSATFDDLNHSLTLEGATPPAALHELGAGPNGSTALTRDPTDGRRAVLKRLHPERVPSDPGSLSVPGVEHPSLAQARLVDARLGLLLREHADGLSLADWARAKPHPGAWLDLIGGIAAALAALHASGEVHGNLKPDNLFMTHAGRPLLLDPLPKGAREWVHWDRAPELTNDAPGTPEADMWALGALLRLASDLAGGMPPWAGELCRHLLDANPATRLTSAGLLRQLLERSLLGIPWPSMGLLGRGGMGEVHLAHDPDLDRTVARKSLRPDRLDQQRRFLAEARITARLQHPGIVPVHALGRFEDGRPFYVMKEVLGRTLHDLMQLDTPSLERRLEIFQRTCEPIAYAHSIGVIHRDIKPANVMVGTFGEVLVLDWGLVKVEAQEGAAPGDQPANQTLAGSVIGTPAFMAPEQARGEPVGPAADVYALGGVLYYLLTGQAPYAGDSAVEVLDRVVRHPPPPPSSLASDIPPELEALCLQAMDRDRDQRIPDASALVAALDEAMGSWRAHAGSRELVAKALPHLGDLREAIDQGSRATPQVGEAWEAVRSALEQALTLWPENPQANDGLAEARALLETWTRTEERGTAPDEHDEVAEEVLLAAITRGERVAASIRFVVGCLGLTIELASSSVDRVLAGSPEALAITGVSAILILFSPAVWLWLKSHTINRRVLAVSVTLDVCLAAAVPAGFVMSWGDQPWALPWVPGTYFVALAVTLAGARLSPLIAAWGGALALALVGVLTWLDLARGAEVDALFDYFALYVLLLATAVFAVAVAIRGRSLVHRALANARAAARGRQLLGVSPPASR